MNHSIQPTSFTKNHLINNNVQSVHHAHLADDPSYASSRSKRRHEDYTRRASYRKIFNDITSSLTGCGEPTIIQNNNNNNNSTDNNNHHIDQLQQPQDINTDSLQADQTLSSHASELVSSTSPGAAGAMLGTLEGAHHMLMQQPTSVSPLNISQHQQHHSYHIQQQPHQHHLQQDQHQQPQHLQHPLGHQQQQHHQHRFQQQVHQQQQQQQHPQHHHQHQQHQQQPHLHPSVQQVAQLGPIATSQQQQMTIGHSIGLRHSQMPHQAPAVVSPGLTISSPPSVGTTRLSGSGSSGLEPPHDKRELRLQKNREAAKECRRKKKEYIKCLENRVALLENQNKALVDELKALKDLYCKTTAEQ